MNNIRKYKPPHGGERELDKMLSTVLVYLEESIRLDEEAQPRRQCCGQTENLQSGWSGGNLRWLCPACAYEAKHPGM